MASSKIVKLAVIINNYSDEDKYLLIKQTPPPKFNEEEYNSYIDSDLWDLPSATLNSFQGQFQQSGLLTEGPEYDSTKINLTYFDFESALDQIISQVGFRGRKTGGNWILQKYVEEAEFGPGPPVNTLFISGNLGIEYENPQGVSRWMSIQSCLDLLLEVKPSSDRVGPLIVLGLLNKHVCSEGGFKVSPPLCYQEYPPGITIVPMASKTAKPFYTTNLVIIAPKNATDDSGSSSFAVNGDALIMDPGCRMTCHKELMEIVAALPRKLVVFVTHHHYDHVEGLSIIQKCNPDATLLAHENTIRRIRKDHWSLGYTAISGGEEICIGGQRLNVISAPGHTDGHMALHHVRTHSLIVGDHCVGQGSAILDIESGGNLKDYFETTYKFLDLSPHVLIPMHGRVNLWPKNMLCKYLKNRRSRESAVLKAIQNGAETLFDIVAKVYSDVNPSFWIPASSNVRIHVEHLVQEGVLPEEFSIQKFQKSCRLQFIWRWAWVFVKSSVAVQYQKQSRTNLFSVSAVVMGIAMFYVVKPKLISK